MPNAGDREAQIASKVQEAADYPKALLLGVIGAICSTPSESAKTAEDLELSLEEIRYARWVALFKKGKTRAEFLKELGELLEDSDNTETPEEREMKVVRGPRYYKAVVRNKTRPVGVWLYNRARREIAERGFQLVINRRDPHLDLLSLHTGSGQVPAQIIIEAFVYGNSEFQVEKWKEEGFQWPDLHIRIRDKKYFYLAQAIGRAYEKRVRRGCVTIERDYPIKG